MTRTKTVKRKKVTGIVSALSAGNIRVDDVPNRKTWNINPKPPTKVTVIRGKPLRLGSTVTVEFKTSDAKQFEAGDFPGRRTEKTGTVIGLTAQWIKLTANDGTWNISRADDNTQLVAGTLALNSYADIVFLVPPGYLA